MVSNDTENLIYFLIRIVVIVMSFLPIEIWNEVVGSCEGYYHQCLLVGCLRETDKWLSKLKFPIKPIVTNAMHNSDHKDDKKIPLFSVAVGCWYEQLVHWLYAIGARPTQHTTLVATLHPTTMPLQYLISIGVKFINEDLFVPVMFDRVESIEVMHKTGVELTKTLLTAAAYSGSNNSFIYLHKHGAGELDPFILHEIGAKGNLELTNYAISNDAWQSDIGDSAAREDHLECLQICLERGMGKSVNTAIAAAEGGAIRCLKYAWENNIEFNNKVIRAAIRGRGSIECVKYLISTCGLELPLNALEIAQLSGNDDLAEWIESYTANPMIIND